MEKDTTKGLNKVIRIDESEIRGHLDKMVRGTVEDTLNALLEAEADEMRPIWCGMFMTLWCVSNIGRMRLGCRTPCASVWGSLDLSWSRRRQNLLNLVALPNGM